MPATIAATAATNLTTTTRPVSFDFAGKSGAPGSAADAMSFASKLLDARQKSPSKAARSEQEPDLAIEESRPAEKVSRKEEASPADSAREVEEDRAADAPKESEEPKDEHESDDDDAAQAMLAALAALAGEQARPADEAVVAEGEAGATDAVATLAAAGLVADQAEGTDLAGGDPQAMTADPAAQHASKEGNAKLNAALKEMEPADDASVTLSPDAVVAKADAQGDRPPTDGDADADAQAAAEAALGEKVAKPDDKASAFKDLMDKLTEPTVAPQQSTEAKPTQHAAAPATVAAPVRPEHQFAHDNVDNLVKGVQSQAAAGGNGSMRVRLDPPELGALDVALKMVQGKMTASFTTSNDQATQLLSHSLNQLKGALETAGIVVDRLEVRQAAPAASASGERDSAGQQSQQGGAFASSQQQGEQQRKQLVDRLWRKYAYGSDEVDLVA